MSADSRETVGASYLKGSHPSKGCLMRFDDLLPFITEQMRMSHIYQPLLIRALVDAGGAATLRQLAHAFLAQDESQLRFCEQRVKEISLGVVAKHGVVRHDGQLVSVAVPDLT